MRLKEVTGIHYKEGVADKCDIKLICPHCGNTETLDKVPCEPEVFTVMIPTLSCFKCDQSGEN
jgi:hypothetical protein